MLPAALVLAPPLAVAPAEVVSLSDLVLDCCSMLFLFFFSALRLLLFVLGLSTSVLAPAAAPVSPFARSVVAPAAPRLPEVVSLEPVLAPAPTPAPAPDLSVLTSAPTFAPAEPCVVVLCAAANWLKDTASTPEISTGNNLRITLFLRL